MKKMLFLGLASVAALVPATIGLTANPSLSAKVPVPSIQVPLSTSSHDAGDDKGGLRSERVSDDTRTPGPTRTTDGAHHNRHSGDDGAAHDRGDDHGGRHGGHGSDD